LLEALGLAGSPREVRHPESVDKSGATCKRCKEHNEYAAPSAAYVCYRCRV
jgi:hypothetical protein